MLYFYAFLVMLDFVAIILVINEDVFYEVEDKVSKIFWIILIPFLGAVFVIIKLSRLHDGSSPKSAEAEDIINYDYVDPHNVEW